MIKQALIIILISTLLTIQLYPQTPPYYHYDSSDGLASSTVFDVIQDNSGYIWLGTLNGLSRFDGKNFKNFTINDGLNSNVITSLLEGDKGEMFIGNYEKGINVLRNGIIENFRDKVKDKNFNMAYILKFKGKLYTYISYGAIIIIDEKNKKPFADSIIYTNPVTLNRLKKTTDNKLMALTSKGLYNVDNFKLTKINIKGLNDSTIYCLAENNDGSYLIGAKGLIYQVKSNKVIKKIGVNLFPDKIIYHIYCDRNNNIWFSVFGKGFYLISSSTGKVINVGAKMGLENTQICCFYEDKENNLWISTYGKGVYCLNNLYLRNFTEKDGLNNDNITCLSLDKSGKLIIGTIDGIDILENGVVHLLTDNSGRALSGYINGIYNPDDFIYVCWASETPEIRTANFKELKFRFLNYPSFLKTAAGYYLYGSLGNSYSLQKEFNYFVQRSMWYPVFNNQVLLNRVNVIAEDTKGNIWTGTSMGLCRLTRTGPNQAAASWKKTFFPDNPVLSSKINSIFVEGENSVWFTGAKGLARYNLSTGSISSYTSLGNNKLNTPTSVVSDYRNRIWIGTMKGLYLIDGSEIKMLSSQTGLPSDEILSLNYDNRNNLLYIGTSRGLTVLDMKFFDLYKQHSPTVKINGIKAGDSLFVSTDVLNFEPDQNNVYIDFVALDYSAPGSIKYRYILNSDTAETENNFLDFSSLKNGVYNLKLAAKTQNSEWGEATALTFRIMPKFTETPWFNLLIFFSLAAAFTIVAMWRLQINNRKIRQQLELTERINDLKHQALSAMMNPHFIFNALNSVQYLINFRRNDEANDYIAMMAKLIRKNLDTAGKGFILLSDEISRLRLYLDLEKMRFQEKFSYDIIAGKNVDIDSIMIPNMIVQPFVENSLWHGIIDSGRKGILTISFSFEDIESDSATCKALVIKIRDNGIGINEAKKNKNDDHISRGIQIIEERLSLLSSKMLLPKPIVFEDLSNRNNDSRGTEVIISLPEPMYKII